MGEIVTHNKSNTRINGDIVSAEEKADYLLKNHYPTPTDDRDTLIQLILDAEDKLKKVNSQSPDGEINGPQY